MKFPLLLLLALFPGPTSAVADVTAPAAAPDEAARVLGQVRRWQPTAEERRFDEIGWARDIRQGIQLARKHGRPVFLFTHDGHMNVGRC
jgi:hypothetical protein